MRSRYCGGEFGTTTFPVISCGYTATQYRSAYGANMTSTGKGQTIAFAEAGGLEPDMFKTLQDFAKQFRLPAPAAARYKEINQQPASCKDPGESAGEEQMDVSADGVDGMIVGEINAKGQYININDAGTSLSAPLVAGMVVAAQQSRAFIKALRNLR